MAEHCERIRAPERPLFVCTGSDCRKSRKKLDALRSTLENEGQVCVVKCQKICKGPVVGVEIGGRLEWFSKISDLRAREHLLKLLQRGEFTQRLRARLVKKRRGKLRGGAAAKVSKAA